MKLGEDSKSNKKYLGIGILTLLAIPGLLYMTNTKTPKMSISGHKGLDAISPGARYSNARDLITAFVNAGGSPPLYDPYYPSSIPMHERHSEKELYKNAEIRCLEELSMDNFISSIRGISGDQLQFFLEHSDGTVFTYAQRYPDDEYMIRFRFLKRILKDF